MFYTDEVLDQLKPAYFALILGVVLTEEISLSVLNTSMLVRAAHFFVVSPFSPPDLLKKAILFCLAIAGATHGAVQSTLTFIGIILACLALLANLGSRSWHFMGWRPLSYNGPCAAAVAYFVSVLTGICLPFLGHRSVTAGGKAAIETVMKSALLVAFLFIVSDFDEVQKILVVGSEVSVVGHGLVLFVFLI